jgi:hypothetical protein
VRTNNARTLATLAALAIAVGGIWTLILTPTEAEASYSYLGADEATGGATDLLSSDSEQLREAVTSLAHDWNFSLPSASYSWLDRSDERSALVLSSEAAKCLIEETDLGVNAVCDTTKNVADHGLFLARFLRESRETDQIDEVVVLAASPSWATHLWTSAEAGPQPIGDGFHSMRFVGDQVQGIDNIKWQSADHSRSESVGLELPIDLPFSSER